MTIQIELESLRKESDKFSIERRQKLESKLQAVSAEVGRLTKRWEDERSTIAALKKAKEQLELARLELEKAQRNGDYAKASELRYSSIPKLESRLPREGAELSAKEEYEQILIHDSVRSADIENVVSRQTGIPVTKLMSGYVFALFAIPCSSAVLILEKNLRLS